MNEKASLPPSYQPGGEIYDDVMCSLIMISKAYYGGPFDALRFALPPKLPQSVVLAGQADDPYREGHKKILGEAVEEKFHKENVRVVCAKMVKFVPKLCFFVKISIKNY